MQIIDKSEVRDLIEAHGRRFFTATIIKKDGTMRVLNGHRRIVEGHTLANLAAHKENIITMVLADTSEGPQFRNIDIDRLLKLAIGGQEYEIKG